MKDPDTLDLAPCPPGEAVAARVRLPRPAPAVGEPAPGPVAAPPPPRPSLVRRWRRINRPRPNFRWPRWPRWARWGAWPKWVKALSVVSGILMVAALSVVAVVWVKYSKIAAAVDMGAIDELEKGCLVVDHRGGEVGRIFIEDRRFVELDETPQHVRDAIIATEDSRFYSHGGCDVRGMFRAAVKNLIAMEIRQGASTITQQLARHVYRLRGRTFDRKLTEIFVARRLEKAYSKDQILGHYINRIYLGSGYYGIGSAAKGYFGKEVSELTIPEAATLAGIIKSPSRYSPFIDQEKARTVRDQTLGRMRALGMISDLEFEDATAADIAVVAEEKRDNRPFFALEAARREIEARFPDTLKLDRGTVTTTLDARLVETAIDSIQTNLSEAERRYPHLVDQSAEAPSRLEGAAVILENRTGRILAAVGGRDYRESSFDRAFLGRRPPGTAFLPFTYAAFFSGEPGAPIARVLDAPLDNRKVMIGGTDGMLGEWGKERQSFEGYIPAAYALLHSKTGAAVRTGNKVGIEEVRKTARASGIVSELRPYPATFLGVSDVRVIEMARAYTVFANGGQPCPPPRLIDSVEDHRGVKHQPGYGADDASPPGIDASSARSIREILAARMRSLRYDSILGEHGLSMSGLAGQCGNSHGFTDAWFIGFDRDITCAVWVGHIDGRGLGVNDAGRNLAMPIWAEIMAAATRRRPIGWKFDPSSIQYRTALCLTSGQVAHSHCAHDPTGGIVGLRQLLGSADPKGYGYCTEHGKGMAVRTIPRAKPVGAAGVSNVVQPPVVPASPAVRGRDPYRLTTEPDPVGSGAGR